MPFPVSLFLFLLLFFASSLLSNFMRLAANGLDGFSANVHQSVLVEFVSSPQQQGVQKRGAGVRSGGEEKQRKISRERVVRHHQQQKNRRKCERLSEPQKYAKLERVGGRNQIFLAASPREAGRNFPTLMPKKADNWKSLSDEEEPTEMTFADFPLMDDGGTTLEGPPTASPLPTIEECDERCREIERKLNGVMELRWQRTEEDDVFRLDDDVDEEPGMEDELGGGIGANWVTGERSGGGVGLRLRRSGCYLEKFVPIGNCTKHGFEESFGDEKLCTACQGIYVLNRECFPVFVNSVVCDRREFECIYDRLSGCAQGKCRPKVLSFKVMRNRGMASDCEHWVYEYIEVPVACECYLSKRSVWLEAVPPSIGEEHLR
uniref:Uncharacterized protein n=1 Tax=Globodera rostochiensis TaxID=31243 RepID=A0A914HH27_GLORO